MIRNKNVYQNIEKNNFISVMFKKLQLYNINSTILFEYSNSINVKNKKNFFQVNENEETSF